MKKILASILTLCMAASIAAAGWTGSFGAAAESLTETVAEATVESAVAETAVTEAPTTVADETTGVGEGTAADPAAAGDPAATSGDTSADAADPAATTGDGTAVTDAPSATPTTEPTAAPDAATLTDAVAAAAEAGVEEGTVIGSGPAWVENGEGRQYGDLYTLLPIAKMNDLTIHLCSMEVFALYGYSIEGLQTYAFAIDADALGDACEGCSVIISAISPSLATADGVVYLWVGLPESVPTAADLLGEEVQITDDTLEAEIEVQSDTYTADAPCTPTFTLTAYPELSEGMSFAVITDGGEPQAMEGNTFAPTATGTYTFAILDAQGQTVGVSQAYAVLYGTPETADAAAETDAAETDAAAEEPVLTESMVLRSVSLAATLTGMEEQELTVDAYDYVDGVETSVTPTFVLSGATVDGTDHYGFTVDGGSVIRLKSDTYTITADGDHVYVFYLLNSEGTVLDTSGEYHVVLNFEEARENNEAWMDTGDKVIYGSLASLLRQAGSGQTIYLLTSAVLTLSDASALDGVSLEPDPDFFGSDYSVVTSSDSPDGNTVAGTTYVWVGVDVDESQFALMSFLSAPAFTLDTVSIGGRTMADNLWVNGSDPVTFTLTDPDAANTYVYEVSIDGGGSYQTFANGGTFGSLTPAMSSGTTYTVIFRITDADDATNMVTQTYTLRYDNISPILICKAGTDQTLSFYAGDSISGFATDGSMPNVTFAASASPVAWAASLTYLGQNVYTYSVQYKGEGTIPANTLGVRDQANNVAVWGTDIAISSAAAMTATGAMSAASGGSSGGSSRTVYHSASTYTTVTAYNGVELVVETGAMQSLVIGDQALDLSLQLSQGAQAPEGFEPEFTADFVNWNKGSATTDDEDENVDTLVLTAADASSVDEGDYCWTFDGSVYKKLAASGIDYLVLNIGDNAVAISTAGFAAGIRYNMYRASGLASSAFVYSVRLSADPQTGTVAPSIDVTVDGQSYTLSADQNSEFYYYNVYSGTLQMLDQPFGQTSVQGSASTGRQG